jgi:SagB-type dehydrogenase family enzyme
MYSFTGAPTEESILTFELYHENSKQRRSDLSFIRRIYQVNNNAEIHNVISRTFKSYPGAAFTPLPNVTPSKGASFEHVAAARRSIRRFSGQQLDLKQLSRLLFFGNGITGRLDASEHGIVQPVRAAPSAGALYPVELYVAVEAVEGLVSGLYHYAVDRHGMEFLTPGSLADVLSEATSDRATFSNAAAAFILTGAFGRAHFKYGERGYRFALLEAGHICQNILMAATALGLGAVALGGFVDDEVNSTLDLDGVNEAAIYLIAAGYPAERPGGLVDRLLVALSSVSSE